MNYYKATRPDGTDFYTGTVDYARALETGEIIRHPAAARVRDDASTYLSVSIAPADCTGMSWPCRLFRVAPVGRTLRATNLPNKRACSALRVVEELPAWQALGPNGVDVAAHIERCRSITLSQSRVLNAAWGVTRGATWDTAWGATRVAPLDAAWGAAWGAARGATLDAVWGSTQVAPLDAALGATLALVVRDLITPEQFDILYGPWGSVMEAQS